MTESVPVSSDIPAGESKILPVEAETIKQRVEEVVQWVDSVNKVFSFKPLIPCLSSYQIQDFFWSKNNLVLIIYI